MTGDIFGNTTALNMGFEHSTGQDRQPPGMGPSGLRAKATGSRANVFCTYLYKMAM